MLKPVSDQEREFLSLLGESAADHQSQVMRVQGGKAPERKQQMSSALKLLKEHNKAVMEAAMNAGPNIQQLVATLPEIQWIPDAYVQWIRKTYCKCCRGTEECLDYADIFLRHKKAGKYDPSHPYLYTPVQVISHVHLPKITQVVFRSTPFCRTCWTKQMEEKK